MTEKLNTSQVANALAQRYSGQEWVFLQQVRNATGFPRTLRIADAIAMNTYPSRGLEVLGFEIKTSRTDWVREMKEPDKAEEIFKYCDRWWIVVGDAEIVKPGELPPTWGLMVPRGAEVMIRIEAPKLESVPLDRKFLASMLRSAKEQVISQQQKDDLMQRRYDEGFAAAKKEMEYSMEQRSEHLKRIKERVAEFETKSGLTIDTWRAKNVGDAVRMLMDPKTLNQHLLELRTIVESHERQAKSGRDHLQFVEKAMVEITMATTPAESTGS